MERIKVTVLFVALALAQSKLCGTIYLFLLVLECLAAVSHLAHAVLHRLLPQVHPHPPHLLPHLHQVVLVHRLLPQVHPHHLHQVVLVLHPHQAVVVLVVLLPLLLAVQVLQVAVVAPRRFHPHQATVLHLHPVQNLLLRRQLQAHLPPHHLLQQHA